MSKELITSLKNKRNDHSLDTMTALWRITSFLSNAYTKKRVGEIIVNEGFSLLKAHSGDILLIYPDKSLKIVAQKGYHKNFLKVWGAKKKKSPLLTEEVVRTGKPVYIKNPKDIKPKYEVAKKFIELTGSKSAVLLPLKTKNKIIGILQFTFKKEKEFDSQDKIFMNTLAFQCAQAFERVIALEDLKKTNRQLKVENRIKDDFISMVSHELKTPITSMKLFLDLLSRDLESNKNRSKTFISRISEQLNRLQILVNDLLDVSRIQQGKLNLHPEVFKIDVLLKEFISEQKWILNNHKLKLDNIESFEVNADKLRIYQVLTNFLTNAVKYSPEGSDIVVSVNKNKSHIEVSVKDFGVGISKQDQSRIFERFFQATNDSKTGIISLGMGLYISRQIINEHKGEIWVKSKKGEGSTFYFSLPIYKSN